MLPEDSAFARVAGTTPPRRCPSIWQTPYWPSMDMNNLLPPSSIFASFRLPPQDRLTGSKGWGLRLYYVAFTFTSTYPLLPLLHIHVRVVFLSVQQSFLFLRWQKGRNSRNSPLNRDVGGKEEALTLVSPFSHLFYKLPALFL